MERFNLIDEPWIPCLAGGTARMVSLREALTQAQEIDEIVDVSPLTTIAMHRLMLAILHRCFGPRQERDWNGLWKARGWEIEPVTAYLEEWHPRFFLLDPDRPFFQHPLIEAEWSPPQRLSHELGPANAGMFVDVPEGTPMSPDEAARYLLAYQLFSPGGLVGLQKDEDRVDRRRFKFARAAPLASSAVCLTTGQTLAETMLLNMVYYDPPRLPFPGDGDDRPVWERDELPQVVERRPAGLLDWLTWPCRRIRLRAGERQGQLVVDGVLIMKGDQLRPEDFESEYEQMVAYRIVPTAKPPQNPRPPVGFERDRAVWRDSGALLQSAEPEDKQRGHQRPKTLNAIANRELGDDPEATNALPIDLFGINLDQFNVLFWRHERLPVPAAYLSDAGLYEGLQRALRLAEDSGRTLHGATRRLAEMLLSPNPDRRADPKAVSAMVEGMGAGRRYWARLGDHFTQFLWDQQVDHVRALQAWADELRVAARGTFDEVADGQIGEEWAWMARVEAERQLHAGLSAARKHHVGDIEEVMHATP